MTQPVVANRSVVRIVIAVIAVLGVLACGVILLVGGKTDTHVAQEAGAGLIFAGVGIAALCL